MPSSLASMIDDTICVAANLQINLEALGMSECHCTLETLGESVQYFVANVMLKG